MRNDRLFGLLTVLSFLLQVAAPDTGWREGLLVLIGSLSEADLRHMGFPDGWERCPMWAPWALSGDGSVPEV